MSRRGRDETFLFDLPLTPEGDDEAAERLREPERAAVAEAAEEPAEARQRSPSGPGSLFDDPFDPAFDEPLAERPPPHRPSPQPAAAADDPPDWAVVERAADLAADGEVAEPAPGGAPIAAPRTPGLAPRLLASGVDGLVLATVAGLALVGATLLDVRPGAALLPGLTLLLVIFSFAYAVVPLAFWGATPGMAAIRLVSRDRDGGPLTFGQTAMRWLAGLVTLLLAGLPLLLATGALGSRSLADRLSGSLTWQRP